MRYPRDMHGYGQTPPNANWPGGAHVAVQFVLNYEEGGENNILHGDAASEAFLVDVLGSVPWPGQGTEPSTSTRKASEAASPCRILFSPPSS